jgi:hypothetical protein
MAEQDQKIRLIGRREFIQLPLMDIGPIEAKIDTGAYTSSLHCENISIVYENSKPVLYLTIESEGTKTFRYESFTQKKIKNSFGEMEERFVIKTIIRIGKKKIWTSVSLSNRDNMRYPALIGRRMLKGKFIIDPNQIHTGGVSLKRAFKLLKQSEQNNAQTDES